MPTTSHSMSLFHDRFLQLLPGIERTIRFRLQRVPPREREELHAVAVAAAFVMFVRLAQRRRLEFAQATPLATYGARQALDGRAVGTPQNSRDVASRACQRKTGLRLMSLHRQDRVSGDWRHLVVEDRQASPADVAITRIDLEAWLQSLTPRRRQAAELLATGESTQAAARCLRVTPGRISQLRRELEASWKEFQGDPLSGAALQPV